MKKFLIASAATLLFAAPLMVQAHDNGKKGHNVYWHDSAGVYVKDSAGKCVRSNDWFAGSQVEGCDEIKMAAPSDADGDGVVDANDSCPNTPAGVAVNSRGCPLDSDNDGVPNYLDKCPGTRAGATVDANGCEIKAKVLMEVNLNVNFQLNSAEITEAYSDDIKRVADFMKRSPESVVVVEGHTDATGTDSYNQDLSQRRADAVASRLINNHGISADRVKTMGFGESRPIADNKTREGRAANRRVVALVKGMVEK